MPYLSASDHAALIASPSSIASLWTAHQARFRTDLGSGFAAEIDEHLKLAFCAMVAHDLKPYGACTVIDLPGMLASTVLDCDNYAALTWHLFKLLVPSPVTTIAIVGWDGGPIGNHAQIFCEKAADANGNGGGYWMIDPTVAVFQCGYNFDGIASGKPCLSAYRKSLYQRPGSATDQLHSNVVNALANGAYRPSHLLYYFDDLTAFSYPPPANTWPTPQATLLT